MFDFKNFFLDLLFEKKCLGCGRAGFDLCPDCFETLEVNGGNNLLGSAGSKYLDEMLSAADYNQPILIKTLHYFKYNFISELGENLGKLLVNFLRNQYSSKPFDFDLIIPVPLAKKRLIWRGFNQAELLAKVIGLKFNCLMADNILIRRAYSRPQVGLSTRKRQKNILGAFALKDSKMILAGKKVLLVDDIFTTGATLNEAAKILKQAKAAKVVGLVVAKVDSPDF